jgi:hypothetical protein
MSDPDDLLTPAAAAQHLGIKPVTLRKWRSKGLIKPAAPGIAAYRRGDLDKIVRPKMGAPVTTGNWVGYRERNSNKETSK